VRHWFKDLLALGLVQLALALSCSTEPEPTGPVLRERTVLAPLLAVVPVAAERDPLSEHRPATVECNDIVGFYVENGGIEVNTGKCNYLAVREPAVVAAPKGAWLTTEISHFDLTAPEPTEAHVAVLIGDHVLWQRTIAVPGEAKVYPIEVELPTDVYEGDDVGLHLHNHGQNTYLLQKLYVSPTRGDQR
jgi:hypothetical protein